MRIAREEAPGRKKKFQARINENKRAENRGIRSFLRRDSPEGTMRKAIEET